MLKMIGCDHMEEKKAVSDAQKRAHKKYMQQYVEVKVRMTPERRSMIQTYAAESGESVTAFINKAIDERIERGR